MNKPRKADSAQAKRFADAAKEVGASEDPADFDRMLRDLGKAKPPDDDDVRKPQKAKKPAK